MADIPHVPKTKVCTRCERRRPVDEFGRSDRYADGLRPHCMRCRVEYTREWRQSNRDEVNAKKRAYEARPEVKARRRARDRRRKKRLAA
jgi:hypothetical protein